MRNGSTNRLRNYFREDAARLADPNEKLVKKFDTSQATVTKVKSEFKKGKEQVLPKTTPDEACFSVEQIRLARQFIKECGGTTAANELISALTV